jgi:hypothetical protein
MSVGKTLELRITKKELTSQVKVQSEINFDFFTATL